MRKIFIKILYVFFFPTLLSCTENDIHQGSTTAIELPEGVSLIGGALHFKNEEAAQNYLELTKNLSTNDLLNFENNNNFSSAYSITQLANKILDNASSQEEFEKYLEEYNNLYEIDKCVMLEIYHDERFSKLSNVNGIYFVDKDVRKVTKDYVFIDSTGDINHLTASIRHIELSNQSRSQPIIDGLNLIPLLYAAPKPDDCYTGGGGTGGGGTGGGGTGGGGMETYTGDLTCSRTLAYNNYKSGDRMLTFQIWASHAYVDSYVGGNYRWKRPQLTIICEAHKKNLWGIWKRYSTSMEFKDVYVEVFNGENYYSILTEGQTGSDRSVFRFETWVGEAYKQYTNSTTRDIYLTDAEGRATSRGIGDNWAVLNCGIGR